MGKEDPLYQLAWLLQKGWAVGVRAPNLAAPPDQLARHRPIILKRFLPAV